jgi:FKBP-type peptidyl-prolyl cis-trans isomerase SlyD
MSKIAPGKYVVLDYVLCDEEGDVIQRSIEPEIGPLEYVHGYSPILPGLEAGVAGLSVGEKKQVTVPPEQGYGLANEDDIFEVDRSELPDPENVKFGDEIEGEDDDGNTIAMHVIEVHDEYVVVDMNHPLAGFTLVWDVTVTDVRDATPAEIEQARAARAELDHVPGDPSEAH